MGRQADRQVGRTKNTALRSPLSPTTTPSLPPSHITGEERPQGGREEGVGEEEEKPVSPQDTPHDDQMEASCEPAPPDTLAVPDKPEPPPTSPLTGDGEEGVSSLTEKVEEDEKDIEVQSPTLVSHDPNSTEDVGVGKGEQEEGERLPSPISSPRTSQYACTVLTWMGTGCQRSSPGGPVGRWTSDATRQERSSSTTAFHLILQA